MNVRPRQNCEIDLYGKHGNEYRGKRFSARRVNGRRSGKVLDCRWRNIKQHQDDSLQYERVLHLQVNSVLVIQYCTCLLICEVQGSKLVIYCSARNKIWSGEELGNYLSAKGGNDVKYFRYTSLSQLDQHYLCSS